MKYFATPLFCLSVFIVRKFKTDYSRLFIRKRKSYICTWHCSTVDQKSCPNHIISSWHGVTLEWNKDKDFYDVIFSIVFYYIFTYKERHDAFKVIQSMYGTICRIEYGTLREKCPNTEFFLVRIFLYSDWIRSILQYFEWKAVNATGKIQWIMEHCNIFIRQNIS